MTPQWPRRGEGFCNEQEEKEEEEEEADGENPTTAQTQVTTQRLKLPDSYSRAAGHLFLVTQDKEGRIDPTEIQLIKTQS